MITFPFEVIDLTHVLSPITPSWSGDCGFRHELVLDYETCPTPVKFRVQKINMHAGIGTRMDAPVHCISGGKTIGELSLTDLIAPCMVIDISKQAHPDYQCSVIDIQNFEQQYGTIPEGVFVIIRTGWDRFWHQPEHYRNNLKFPSVSLNAAHLFLDRNIVGLGIDTLSPDTEASGYPVHQAILGAGKYLVENVANADKLPPVGSFSLVMPILTEGGTEAPIRLIGLVKNNTNHGMVVS